MNKIKKMVIAILIFVCMFSFTSCEHFYHFYNYGIAPSSQEELLSIEFIKYEDLNVENDPQGDYELNLEEFTILETLTNEKCYNFAVELAKIGGVTTARSKDILHSPLGYGIKINYSDNEIFTVITLAIIDGEEWLFFGNYYLIDLSVRDHFSIEKSIFYEWIDEFKELTNQYFEHQLD